MRIVVTGGAGFVGSHIAERLIHIGHEVDIIDNLSSKVDFAPREARIRHLDLTTDVEVEAPLKEADLIVHAAAYADLRGNWDSFEKRNRLYTDNIQATVNVLEAKKPETPLVFLSTASVYGAAEVERDGPWAVSEADALPETCESPYAASKMACEALIASYAFAQKFPWHIFRLVNVVGSRTSHGVIGDFVNMARRMWCTEHKKYVDGFCDVCNGDRNLVTGHIHAADNGRQRKSWVHVYSVCDAVEKAVQGMPLPSGVYSVTSDKRISWWDIIDAMGIDRANVTYEDKAGGAIGDPIDLWVSGVKLNEHVGTNMPPMLGVQDALDFLGWVKP